jgi:hypothetical protein
VNHFRPGVATVAGMVEPGGVRAVVLVEGRSDQSAVRALTERRGISLAGEGIDVVAMGGASNIGTYLERYGPRGAGLRFAGLYDAREVGYFRRALERAGLLPRYTGSRAQLERSASSRRAMEAFGFFPCDVDLEDELIRALGPEATLAIIQAEGELAAFRSLQQQPDHRGHQLDQQLHRFIGTRAGRKIRYGRLLVEALDPAHVPPPLDGVLRHALAPDPGDGRAES